MKDAKRTKELVFENSPVFTDCCSTLRKVMKEDCELGCLIDLKQQQKMRQLETRTKMIFLEVWLLALLIEVKDVMMKLTAQVENERNPKN